jgi:hypothetical protein
VLLHPANTVLTHIIRFHLFGALKGSLQGQHYVAHEALQNTTHQWLQIKHSNKYKVGIQVLLQRRKKIAD